MKIVFAMPGYCNLPIGGYHVHYEYANQLSRRGHDVTILFPRKLNDASRGLRPMLWAIKTRLQNRPLISSYPLDRRVKIRLVSSLDSASLPTADVLIATGWETAEALADAPARCGRRHYIVYDYERWMTGTPEVRGRIAATYRAAFTMVATSAVVEETIRSCGGVPVARISCGLDFSTFGVDRSPVGRNPLTLGFPARDQAFKGANDAVAACEVLRARHGRSLRVACFGRPLDLPDWIEQHPNLSAAGVRAFYNDQAVFLVPSHFEGWGLPGVEAMACGAALVTTDNGGCRDYAIDGVTALVVPPRAPDQLADAVSRLFDDNALRQNIADSGRIFVQRFTWERSADSLEAVLAG